VIESGPASLQEELDELKTFTVSRLARLRGLLADQAAIHEARALLAEQSRVHTGASFRGRQDQFQSQWSDRLFRDKAFTCLDGAGGQTCTILPQAMFFVDLAA